MQDESRTSIRMSSGGMIYDLLLRLHIQPRDDYGVSRRLAFLITLCLLPLIVLSFIEGNLYSGDRDIALLHDIEIYVRFLIALPILVLADTIIDPLIAYMILSLDRSGIISDEHKARVEQAISRVNKGKDSYWADAVILLIVVAIMLAYLTNIDELDISTQYSIWAITHTDQGATPTLAGWWFLLVSSAVLNIILFRWLWRFMLWIAFAYRVSRIPLRLQPSHPDQAGGLGILKNGGNAFALVFFAFGAILSASLAEEIIHTPMTLNGSLPVIATYIVTVIVLLTLPLLFFTRQLAIASRWGRMAYGDLGYRLSRAFDKKWADPADMSNGDNLLDTADSSVVCDYADVYGAVRDMRIIPISLRGFIEQALVLALPFLPLVFSEQSFPDLLKRILESML